MKLKLTIDGTQYEVEVEVAETEKSPSYLRPAGQSVLHGTAPAAPTGTPGSAGRPASPAAPVDESKGPVDESKGLVDERKVCRSPISGVVVRVAVQVGQKIAANDVLLVLEAMKMETVITSPGDGKVAQVHTAPGESVQAGQVLVEFE